MATLTSDSSPATKPVDGEMLLNGQPEPSAADTKPNADHPQIDKLLLDGLAVAKDRLLLLRSDIEMEKLVNDNR